MRPDPFDKIALELARLGSYSNDNPPPPPYQVIPDDGGIDALLNDFLTSFI